MFMILRTSPCYIRQVQSSISPNNSQNISVNSEAWLRARPEQHQTVGEQRLQHLCSGQLQKDSGLEFFTTAALYWPSDLGYIT